MSTLKALIDTEQVSFFSQSWWGLYGGRLCKDQVFISQLVSYRSRHITDGKWIDWDSNNPPTGFIELADSKQTFERPDQWIKPNEYRVLNPRC
jgi:hypothetical protein